MFKNLFTLVAICEYMCLVIFDNAYAMRTGKHIKIDWTEEEQRVDHMSLGFYCRAINNNFDKGESLKDIDDYIYLLKECIENLNYEHPTLNDRYKKSWFEENIFLLNSLKMRKDI